MIGCAELKQDSQPNTQFYRALQDLHNREQISCHTVELKAGRMVLLARVFCATFAQITERCQMMTHQPWAPLWVGVRPTNTVTAPAFFCIFVRARVYLISVCEWNKNCAVYKV